MKNCVFCKIVKGELPCWKIYEDDDFLVFLDILPFTDGHSLVIPKKHFRWVWDVPNIDQFFKVAGKVVNQYRKNTGEKFVVSMIWGRKVPHAHIQILPAADKLKLDWKRGQLSEKKAKKLLQKFSLK
jgi:histidine triad (HIT) family protein